MSPQHHRRGRGARAAETLRWAWDDGVRMVRGWQPPVLPDPDDAEPGRKPRARRFPEPTWGRAPAAAAVRGMVQRRVLFPVLTALARPEVVGLHHLHAARAPFIVAPNHVSHSDAPLVLQALPEHVRARTLVPAAADYFFDRRAVSVAVTLAMNAVPFDRRNEIADSVRRCERFLRHGYSIVLFPEGTRSRDGRLRGFKAGVAHLAVNTGAPVLPMYVQGTHRLLPSGKALPRPSAVTLHIGPALVAEPEETARRFHARLEAAVLTLAAGARGRPHQEAVPEPRPWRETWAAGQPRVGRSVGDTGSDAAWLTAVAAPDALPAPASGVGEGTWITRWRSTTPR